MAPAVGPCSLSLCALSSLTPSLSSVLFCTLNAMLLISQYPVESVRIEAGLTCNKSSSIWTQNVASTLCAPSTAPQDATACPSVVQPDYLSASKTDKLRRQLPQMHLFFFHLSPLCFGLYLSHSLCTETLPSPILSSPLSLFFPPSLSASFLFTGPLQCQPRAPSSRHLQGLHQRQRLSVHRSLFFSFHLSAFLSPENG